MGNFFSNHVTFRERDSSPLKSPRKEHRAYRVITKNREFLKNGGKKETGSIEGSVNAAGGQDS